MFSFSSKTTHQKHIRRFCKKNVVTYNQLSILASMFNMTLASFCFHSFHCRNFMILFSQCDNDFHMLTELCCCCTCNGYCNIFNRHRFQMLSGLLHIPDQLLIGYQHFRQGLSNNSCSSGRMTCKLKMMMFHMVMASSILSLPQEQCTLQCY